MDLLKDDVTKIFLRYLRASFGSALILGIYTIVDTAMVGRYEGAEGVAALAAVAPIWSIIYSLGFLFGIGGAVLMSAARGEGKDKKGNEIYTAAFLGIAVTTAFVWAIIWIWNSEILTIFGADDRLLLLAEKYMKWVNMTIPMFMFGQFLTAFLRNDGAPERATAAALTAGIFNMAGDYFFVFVLDMGIEGAGLATAIGQTLSVIILCGHFFSDKCGLKLKRPKHLKYYLKMIAVTGFSTFFIDIAMGMLSVMFNNQIMRYMGSSALAVYGVIININILVQSCAYGIGQAAQPVISVNFGAKKSERIKKALKCSLMCVAILSILWTSISMAFPEKILNIFMTPSEDVLLIAPSIMRIYFVSFMLLPFNIYATYYFQAIMKPKASFAVSVLRGMVLSGIFIYIFPVIFGQNGLWSAMTAAECIIAWGVIILMKRYNGEMAEI